MTQGKDDTDMMKNLSTMLKQQSQQGMAALFGGSNTPRSGVSVVIHNNTPAGVNVAEGGGSFDRKELEITVDQMVASTLTGGRETSGVLRSLFGIVPNLLGR